MNMYVVEIRRSFKAFLTWIIASILLLSLFLSFFPSMAKSDISDIIKSKINAIPPVMLNALGIDKILDFSDLLKYFAYVLQFLFIPACIYALILGTSSLIKEESEGTIEFLYSKPISRKKIVTIKLLSSFTIIVLYNFLLYFVCTSFAEVYKPNGYEYIQSLMFIFRNMFIVQILFMLIGFVFSTILRKYSQAIPVGLGLFFVTYLLGTFSKIITDLGWLEYFSPYHYVVPVETLKNAGYIEITKVIITTSTIILSIIFTYNKYSKKDFII